MINRHPRHRLYLSLCALGLLLIARPGGPAFAAADPKALSSQLSDKAFAWLATLTKNHDTPSPLLGPVGVFAADSQKLSAALAAANRRAAAVAMASLKADADAVDKAAAVMRRVPDAAEWKAAIRRDLDSLAAIVPAARARAADTVSAESAAPSAPPPAVAVEGTESGRQPSPLAVNIESAQMAGADIVRLKGSLRGRDIRSAGIYLGNSRLAKLGVKPARGSRTIEFNLEIHNPTPGAVLRVYDMGGRSAQAPILGEAETANSAFRRSGGIRGRDSAPGPIIGQR